MSSEISLDNRDQSLISVIMPCYNAAPFLEEALSSVMNQSYPNVELIVIDDGSSDNSVEILERMAKTHPGRIKLLFQQREGPYPARNFGLTHADGKFIAFLDADDWWDSDCLEKLHTALEQSNAVLSYCGWQNIGVQGGRGNPYVPPDYEAGDKAETFLRAAAPWPIHAALVRREVVTTIGGFDTHWPSCMDYDLWLRIGVAHPIVLVPEVMAFYRHHGVGQITSKQWIQAENSRLVKKKFVKANPELVSHLSQDKLKQLIDGGLLRRGYNAYWQRDLTTAWHIFRKSLLVGGWKGGDLKYLIPAFFLPQAAFVRLIGILDRRRFQ
ncbi:MAG: glycosyltransferase [Thiobacillus sp.]|nr:glycosyltransferase [Thiobacillus sp.]